MNKTIGFVGLGIMGLPMAKNLAKAGPVIGYDVRPERRSVAEPDVQTAASLEELCRQCETVFLSLPSSNVVRAVCTGTDGLFRLLGDDALVIDTSTTEPEVSREVARELSARGIRFLDAPVSGGEQAAIDGTLSFMVGGDPAVFNAALPLLRLMGASAVRVGDVGAGEVAKLVNNLIVGITFAAVAEGFSLAAANGLDAGEIYQAIRGGWAGSRVLEVAAKAMLADDYRPGGTVDIHWKDLGYALSLARQSDVPTPMTALAHEVFKTARAAGYGQQAQPAIVKLWETLPGSRGGLTRPVDRRG